MASGAGFAASAGLRVIGAAFRSDCTWTYLTGSVFIVCLEVEGGDRLVSTFFSG